VAGTRDNGVVIKVRRSTYGAASEPALVPVALGMFWSRVFQRVRVTRAIIAALLLALAACHDGSTAVECLPQPKQVDDTTAEVAAFYVAPNGSDNADGSLEHPLATLKEAANRAQPGHTIMLRGGTYDTVSSTAYIHIWSLQGTADAPITIRSYPGEHAIIDGSQHRWHPRTLNDGRNISNPILLYIAGNHLIFQDLTFRHGVGRSFFLEGNHNTLRNITSHGNHSDGIHLRGHYNLLEDIHAYDNNSVANGGDSADGIKIEGGSSHNTIRRAITHHNSDDGIDIWDSTDTLIEHSISYANGIGTTGNGTGFKLGGGAPGPSHVTIQHSIAYANRTNNFDANANGGLTMIHNTSWNAGTHGYVLRHREGTNPPNTAHNNISYQDPKPYVAWNTTTHSHNTWNLAITNPQFTTLDPTSPDHLTLKPTSPAIDKGLDLGQPYTGTAPDLGALEAGQTLVRVMGALWCTSSVD
jgi:hypothetical protein